MARILFHYFALQYLLAFGEYHLLIVHTFLQTNLPPIPLFFAKLAARQAVRFAIKT